MPKRKYQTIVPENYRSAIKYFQLKPLNKKSLAELNSDLRKQGLTPVRIDDLLRGLDIVSPTWRDYHQKNITSTDLKSFGLRKTTGQPIYSLKRPLKRIGPKSVWYCLTNQDVEIKKRRCSNLKGCTPNVDCPSTRDVFPPLPPHLVTPQSNVIIQNLLIQTSNDMQQPVPPTENLGKVIEITRDPAERGYLQDLKNILDEFRNVITSIPKAPKPLPSTPIRPIIPSNNDALPTCEKELEAQRKLLENEKIAKQICLDNLTAFNLTIERLTNETEIYKQDIESEKQRCTKEMEILKEKNTKDIQELSVKFGNQQKKDRIFLEKTLNQIEDLQKQHQKDLSDIQSMSVDTPLETLNEEYKSLLEANKNAEVLAFQLAAETNINQARAETEQFRMELDKQKTIGQLAQQGFDTIVANLQRDLQLKDATIQQKDGELRACDTQRGQFGQTIIERDSQLVEEIKKNLRFTTEAEQKNKQLQSQIDELLRSGPIATQKAVDIERDRLTQLHLLQLKKQEDTLKKIYEELALATNKNNILLGQLNTGLGKHNAQLHEEFRAIQHENADLKVYYESAIENMIKKGQEVTDALETSLNFEADFRIKYEKTLDALKNCQEESEALKLQLTNYPQLQLNIQAYIANEERKNKDIDKLTSLLQSYEAEILSLRTQLLQKNAQRQFVQTEQKKREEASDAAESVDEFIQKALIPRPQAALREGKEQRSLPKPERVSVFNQPPLNLEEDVQMAITETQDLQERLQDIKNELTPPQPQLPYRNLIPEEIPTPKRKEPPKEGQYMESVRPKAKRQMTGTSEEIVPEQEIPVIPPIESIPDIYGTQFDIGKIPVPTSGPVQRAQYENRGIADLGGTEPPITRRQRNRMKTEEPSGPSTFRFE